MQKHTHMKIISRLPFSRDFQMHQGHKTERANNDHVQIQAPETPVTHPPQTEAQQDNHNTVYFATKAKR